MNYEIYYNVAVSGVRFQFGNPTPIPGPNTPGEVPITDEDVRALVNVAALESVGATSDVRYLANLIYATKFVLDFMDPAGVRPTQFYNAFATDTGWVIVDPMNAVYCTADADISFGSQVFGFDAALYAQLQAIEAAVNTTYSAFAAPAWSAQTPFWGRYVGSAVEID